MVSGLSFSFDLRQGLAEWHIVLLPRQRELASPKVRDASADESCTIMLSHKSCEAIWTPFLFVMSP